MNVTEKMARTADSLDAAREELQLELNEQLRRGRQAAVPPGLVYGVHHLNLAIVALNGKTTSATRSSGTANYRLVADWPDLPGTVKAVVTWHQIPPAGVSPQTHKFSAIDAIEQASIQLGAGLANSPEGLVLNAKGRAVLTTLPQFNEEATVMGLFPLDGEYVRLGSLGRFAVWYQHKAVHDVLVFSPTAAVAVMFSDAA